MPTIGVVTHDLLLFLATFLASGVEAVEALTIVLAVGVVRGWRSPLIGVAAAAVVLAVIVAVLGPALRLLPIDTLRLVVGALLLVFGLQWLRKAILRSSGYKALHDEGAAFAAEREQATRVGRGAPTGMDWYSFTVAFKGVLLEGLEIVFIVVTFGAAQARVAFAAAAALTAVALVVVAGIAVRSPLERVRRRSPGYCPAPSLLANQALKPVPQAKRAQIVDRHEDQQRENDRKPAAERPIQRLRAERAPPDGLDRHRKTDALHPASGLARG